jgi:D-alanyl-D-alanine carboxypeptidase/D-alanyl-D-alanine-endopeptidase (penicillin-binding protein 4)
MGSSARIRLSPPTSYVTIDGTVKTVPASQKTVIGFNRVKGTNKIEVSGRRSARKENRYDFATIHNPTLYTVTVLTETLRKSGIQVDGKPVDVDDLPKERKVLGAETLCEYVSPPLSEILPIINKESENLYANQTFLAVGAREFASAGWVESASAVKKWLRSIFVDPKGLVMDDGSGLSTLDRTTARQLAGVLKYMYYRPDRQVFVDSFAVAGEDGTLRKRLNGTKAEGRVSAKTGYIKDVRALSGYVTTMKGETIVFSFLLNNAERVGSRFKVLVDQALLDLTYME